MTKKLLISIRPKYVEAILNKLKPIEIRRLIPRWVLSEVEAGNTVECLIYCTKQKILLTSPNVRPGKIVASFELTKIEDIHFNDDLEVETESLTHETLLEQSQLSYVELNDYVMNENGALLGKVLHIDNLNIFIEPKGLTDYYKYDVGGFYILPWYDRTQYTVKKAPQNMMVVWG